MERAKLSFEGCCIHSKQAGRLQKILHGTLTHGSVNVVLVGGSSGTGKTHLVRSSFSKFEQKYLFASSKVDQKGNNSPFTIIRSLFSDITGQINKSGAEKINDCRKVLQSEFQLSPRRREILVDLIPSTAEFFGHSSSSTATGETREIDYEAAQFSSDDVKSSRLALRTFLRAVSSVMPLVLFLDDMMWSDKDNFDIFRFLLTDDSLNNVLFCVTYRDDEVDETHLFSKWKTNLEVELEQNIQTINVKNLAVTEVQSFLSAALRLDEDRLNDLAILLHERTNGNILHLMQMLENLCNLDLLRYEFVGFQWNYSLHEIKRSTSLGDNVAELVSSRIKGLDQPVQDILKLAACFGARVEVRALEIVQPSMLSTMDDVNSQLDRACQEMMMIRVSENSYKFAHDEIQAAAYGLISSSNEAKETHRRIGQVLLHYSETLHDQTLMFACADQLKRGSDFQKTTEDRIAIAELGLTAGKKAAALSAFSIASDFFKLGIDGIGGTNGFDLKHDLAVELYSLYAKTEQCGGSIDDSKKAAETVLAHVTTEERKVIAYRTLLSCFLASNQLDKLIEFGLDLCKKLGENIPERPKPKQTRSEVKKMRKVLKKTTDTEILSLPHIVDKKKELCMNILYELAMPAYYVGNHLLHHAVVNKMNKITLNHGLSKWSPRSFALSGQHLNSDYYEKEGNRLAKLALVLLGDYENTKQGGHVVYTVAIVKACIEPASSCLGLLLTGYRIAMEAGHIDAAVSSIFNYFWSFFYSGLPFAPLLSDIEQFSEQILDYKRHYMYLLVLPIWQCLLNLSGQADDPSNMEVGKAIERESLVGGNPKGVGSQTLMSYWMQLSFYLGNYDKATELYEKVKEFDMGAFTATMFFNARVFFFALIEIHNYRDKRKRKSKANARKYTELLRKHVAGGAINLVHKVQLLDAEMMKRTSKNSAEVLQKYNEAITSATRSGFLQDAALSNYLCAQYCKSTSKLESSQELYLMKSHEQYLAWGASEVAKSLCKRHPKILHNENLRVEPAGRFRLSRGQFRSASSLEGRHKAADISNIR